MPLNDTRVLDSLGKRCPQLFLAAGIGVAGHGAVRAVDAFTTVAPPPDVFGPAGYLLAVVAMVGLYPALADRSPWLARGAVAVAVVPAVGWLAILVGAAGELFGLWDASVTPGPLFAVHIAGVLATYVLFAAASLRSETLPRAVGALLLVPPLLVVALFVGAAVGVSTVGAAAVGIGQALAHLSVGAVLPAGATAADGTAPAGEPAAD